MFRLFTLGGLRLEGPNGPVTGSAAQPRPLAILAILAVSGRPGVSRDKIVGLLWPDRSEERARHVLSQSLYSLRRGLECEELFLPTHELALNPSAISSDVAELDQAIRAGDDQRAVALYSGPFLDSFYLSSAPEFEAWVSSERERRATQYSALLDRLACAAKARGDHSGAVEFCRRRAALDPLDGRAVLQLLEALEASGDSAAAIRKAAEHTEAVRRELGTPPDRRITEIVARLKQQRRERVTLSPPRTPTLRRPVSGRSTTPVASHAKTEAQPRTDISRADDTPLEATAPTIGRGRTVRHLIAASIAVVSVAAVAGVAFDRAGGIEPKVSPIAVGFIRNHIATDTAFTTRALPDLLATSLARMDGMDVISRARLYEFTEAGTAQVDTGAAFAIAARRAGARELLEGSLYGTANGFRLDVQRVDIASGKVRRTYTVEGPDAVTLVDRTTALLADEYRLRKPKGSLAEVTSVSVVARGFYEEGLRALYVAEDATARRLFSAALAADSTFAMAAHYLALAAVNSRVPAEAYMARARRLAARSTDRERLLILHYWAAQEDDPIAFAYAETLSTRYPAEIDAQLAMARANLAQGDFPGAISRLRKVVQADGNSSAGTGFRCRRCEAEGWLVITLELADSLPAAERIARAGLRANPNVAAAWGMLGTILERQGLIKGADSAYAREEELGGGDGTSLWRAALSMRGGDFKESEDRLRRLAEATLGSRRYDALEMLSKTLRNRGRPTEALRLARAFRRQATTPLSGSALDPFIRLPEALALISLGRGAEAAAQFDTMAALSPYQAPARKARHQSWMMAHRAKALAVAGDTAALVPLVDTIRRIGSQSSYGRDRRLHHYVQGLIWEARRDPARAARAFREARYSTTETYLAVPLARAELALGQPQLAAKTAAAALRGPLDSQNQYELRSELHELLADALLARGDTASAARHYRIVAKAWEGGEPAYEIRSRRAKDRLQLFSNQLAANTPRQSPSR